VSLRTV